MNGLNLKSEIDFQISLIHLVSTPHGGSAPVTTEREESELERLAETASALTH